MNEFIYNTNSDDIKNIFDDEKKYIKPGDESDDEIELPSNCQIQALIDFLDIPQESWEEIEEMNFDRYQFGREEYLIIDENEREYRLRQIAEERALEDMHDAIPDYLHDYFDLDRYTDDIENDLIQDAGDALSSYDGCENTGQDESGDTWYIYRID